MITAKELAEKLNGRAYGDSFDDVKQEAKEAVWLLFTVHLMISWSLMGQSMMRVVASMEEEYTLTETVWIRREKNVQTG